MKHSCPDWDGLVIDENDPEFVCCLCTGSREIRSKKARRNSRTYKRGINTLLFPFRLVWNLFVALVVLWKGKLK